MSYFELLNLLTSVTCSGNCCLCWIFYFFFGQEEKTYYICHCMSWVFLWCHFVVFAAFPDIIKWIDISNICGAQRALIQWRWTLCSSHCGTASGVCLFNHSCWNKIKRQCVVKPLKLLSQQRSWMGGAHAGGRVMESTTEPRGYFTLLLP